MTDSGDDDWGDFKDLVDLDALELIVVEDLEDLWVIKQPVIELGPDETVVSQVAVDLVRSMNENDLEMIGRNKLTRVTFSEIKNADYDGNNIVKEGIILAFGPVKSLKWAKENDIGLFRRMIKDHYHTFTEIAEGSEPLEALEIWRMLRFCHKVSDKISKKMEYLGAGTTTLSKIRPLLTHRLCQTSRVVYGVANPNHCMGYADRVRVCYDTDNQVVEKESAYYRYGDLSDWRDHVQPGELIISDCSLANESNTGMSIPERYYGIYAEMLQSGHAVLHKAAKDQIIGMRVANYCMLKPHNMEIFLLRSPVDEENIYTMDDELLFEMMDANRQRMENIRTRDYGDYYDRYTIEDTELRQIERISKAVYFEGIKNPSVITNLMGDVDYNRQWERLCMDPYYLERDLEIYYKIRVECPAVLVDVYVDGVDCDRLFNTFFHRYEMEFVDEIGWVAMGLKSKDQMRIAKQPP